MPSLALCIKSAPLHVPFCIVFPEKGGRKERISDFEEPDDKKHAIKVDKKSKEKNKKTSNEPESKKTKVESEKHKTNESEGMILEN